MKDGTKDSIVYFVLTIVALVLAVCGYGMLQQGGNNGLAWLCITLSFIIGVGLYGTKWPW